MEGPLESRAGMALVLWPRRVWSSCGDFAGLADQLLRARHLRGGRGAAAAATDAAR